MIVAMYDITGIQEYIFSSTKLKENLGASLIVQRVFTQFFEPLEDQQKLRIVYIGGGNAMVEYDSQDQFKETTCELSKKFVQLTGGSLRFAAHAEERQGTFVAIRKRLMEGLAIKKNRLPGSVPLMGIAITRECPYDGWPTVKAEGGESLSYPAHCKRNVDPDDFFLKTKRLLGDASDAGYCFPKELDKLGQKKEEQNYLAVVHIDGNNMGQTINAVLKDIDDYETAAGVMKQLAQDIDTAYTETFKAMVQTLIARQSDPVLPIRPIILSGDDVTFVCKGELGLKLAEEFLILISGCTIWAAGKKIHLSACAGVAIVKSHFPFHRAYDLAEELCGSAKRKAKVLAKKESRDEVGSWLDFHIVQSGVLSDLKRMRSQHYLVRGMEKAQDIITGDLKFSQHHLLGRPWRVCGPGPQEHDWQKLLGVVHVFRDKWPANRIKRLRNSLIGIPSERDLLLEEIKSRKIDLPDFPGKENGKLFFETHSWLSGTTPYFDAIELQDFYPEMQTAGGSHAD